MVQEFFDDDSAPTLLKRGNCRKNKNPPTPPATSPSPCGPPSNHRAGNAKADQWPGVEGKSCSVIGWRSTWGALYYVADRTTGGWGSHIYDNCHATEELAPSRHQIISVPLYIPYSFMGVLLVISTLTVYGHFV